MGSEQPNIYVRFQYGKKHMLLSFGVTLVMVTKLHRHCTCRGRCETRSVRATGRADTTYFCNIFTNPEIPNSNAPFRVEVLSGHVNVICVFVFILALTVMVLFLQGGEGEKTKQKVTALTSCFPSF